MFRAEQLWLEGHPAVFPFAEGGVDGISLADELVKAEGERAIASFRVRLAIVAMQKPSLDC